MKAKIFKLLVRVLVLPAAALVAVGYMLSKRKLCGVVVTIDIQANEAGADD